MEEGDDGDVEAVWELTVAAAVSATDGIEIEVETMTADRKELPGPPMLLPAAITDWVPGPPPVAGDAS